MPSDQGIPPAGGDRHPEGPAAGRWSGEEELPSVDRLLALSDGVVAIAITVIVFQLHIPSASEVSDARSAGQLASALGSAGGELITYVVTFFVIAQFWLVHHRVSRIMRGHDEGLAWVNFLFLFTISLMPFTSNLLGTYPENPLAVDIFAANLLLASLATQAVARYGAWRRLLVPGVTAGDMAAGQRRALAVCTVLVASMGVAWWSPDNAKYFWIGLFLVPLVVTRWASRSVTPG